MNKKITYVPLSAEEAIRFLEGTEEIYRLELARLSKLHRSKNRRPRKNQLTVN